MRKSLGRSVFAALLLAGLPASADIKPLPTPPARTELAPQAKAAFTALAEPDRKAVQDALGWLGFYNGVVDGAFGKRTIDALAAYQQSVGATADGIVTAKTLAALKDGAAKAQSAVGFRVIDDPVTGVRIGAPLKLLEKRENGQGTAALLAKDGAIGLSFKETTGDLAELYKTLSADAGPRKATYKYMKPDAFFVVAGDEGDNKFYRRYAVSPDKAKLRGFAFVYPNARAKALDPVALAIANTFDPFPARPLAAAATPAPTPTPTPEGPKLTATALVIGEGVAVTALDPKACKAPTVAGKPARFLEGQGPFTRLGGEFGAGASPIPIAAAGGDDLLALSLAGEAHARLQVIAAQTAPGGGKVIAAFGAAASGAPLFDRHGRLVAVVAPVTSAERRAGVVLAAPHATIPASTLGAASTEPAGPALSAAELTRLRRAAILGVFCAS